MRDAVVAAAGGTASVEAYEVVVARRFTMPAAGAVVRLLRIEIPPAAIDDAITLYRSDVLPVLEAAEGLCSLQLLVDRSAGRALGISAWEDEVAVEKALHALDEPRARVVQATGAASAPAEYYTLVCSTAQLD